MIEIRLKDFFGSSPVIAAGATIGIDHFHEILRTLPADSTEPVEQLVALNFTGIDDATPSYVKATLLALHQCGRRFARALTIDEQAELDDQIVPRNVVIVILNASQAVQDCIHEVFARRGLAVLAGTHCSEDKLEQAVLLGELDPAVLQALTLTTQFPEFQAADLQKLSAGNQISVTGWNNRLAELYRQRLVRRRTEGRTHRFIPLANHIIVHGQILSRK